MVPGHRTGGGKESEGRHAMWGQLMKEEGVFWKDRWDWSCGDRKRGKWRGAKAMLIDLCRLPFIPSGCFSAARALVRITLITDLSQLKERLEAADAHRESRSLFEQKEYILCAAEWMPIERSNMNK